MASITIITLAFRGGSTGWLGGVRSAATDVFSPVQSAAGTVFGPVGRFFEGAVEYGAVKSQNAKLRSQVAGLRAQSAATKVLQDQLAALSALGDVPFAGNLRSVEAVVIADSASNFQDTVQLSKGSAAGIGVGMPVVSGAGLVGRVVQVAANRSTVLLVSDPTSNVGVTYAAPGGKLDQALVTGQGAGKPLSVSLVPPGTKLVKGEEMLTSEVRGGYYPLGIPVGTVSSATLAPGAQAETVTLKPNASLGQLEFVKVLMFTPPPGAP